MEDKQALAHEIWQLGIKAVQMGHDDVAHLIVEAHYMLTHNGFAFPKPIKTEVETEMIELQMTA